MSKYEELMASYICCLRSGVNGVEVFDQIYYSTDCSALLEHGVTKKELRELRIKSCKIHATRLLNAVARGVNGVEICNDFIRWIKEELEAGGLTLQDIEVDEAKLDEYRIKAYVISLKYPKPEKLSQSRCWWRKFFT